MSAERRRVYEVLEVAGPDDVASRRCDVFLIALISLNVLATILESLSGVGNELRRFLHAFDIFSVGIFSAEYLLRVWSAVESSDPRFQRPLLGRLRYAVTPLAWIDLLAILPSYAAAFLPLDLRFLRVLRILRILKLSHYFSALDVLLDVVRQERRSFGAAFFLLAVALLFAASGVYLFEHEGQPVAFGSIPAAMWWAVATLTTVGYGDVTPVTVAGKVFGASIAILGVGMVALPTGILASGFSDEMRRRHRMYDSELESALKDGVIDAEERMQLDALGRRLGLSEEDTERIDAERSVAAPASPARRGATSANPEKCPHCGEALQSEEALLD